MRSNTTYQGRLESINMTVYNVNYPAGLPEYSAFLVPRLATIESKTRLRIVAPLDSLCNARSRLTRRPLFLYSVTESGLFSPVFPRSLSAWETLRRPSVKETPHTIQLVDVLLSPFTGLALTLQLEVAEERLRTQRPHALQFANIRQPPRCRAFLLEMRLPRRHKLILPSLGAAQARRYACDLGLERRSPTSNIVGSNSPALPVNVSSKDAKLSGSSGPT
jgi:hypothetical protein